MPSLTGIEATKAIRKYESDNNLKRQYIVALAARLDEKIRSECFSAGMDEFMEKPVDSSKALEILNKSQSFNYLKDSESIASRFSSSNNQDIPPSVPTEDLAPVLNS